MTRVSIVGVTGYTGIELLRLLSNHRSVKVSGLISKSSSGKKLADIYPQYKGKELGMLNEYNLDWIKENSDLVFTALPHGISQKIVVELLEAGLRVIDLSGDFRYRDSSIYEEWYGIEHVYPGYLKKAVYGLVEINREKIKGAELVSNPGCYPTASLLGLWPLVKEGLISTTSIIIDAKSGVSGAGRKVQEATQFIEVDENIKAYKIARHRHTSEIEEVLKIISPGNVGIVFTPHLIPIKRGILATIYADLLDDISQSKLEGIYKKYYPEDGFVQLVPQPETKYLVGSNYCHLGLNVDSRTGRVIIVSAIDNLVKGAAGQAIQNMNLLLGIPEKTGLDGAGIYP